MKTLSLIFSVIFFVHHSNALTPSAERSPDESWYHALMRQIPATESLQGRTALSSARYFRDDVDLSILPVWKGSAQELISLVKQVRDERIYEHSGDKGFLRRSTWLYPNDGCFARAEHVARGFARRGLVRPGKVLAFGNLRFATTYGPRATVYWSYHVAAAFRIGGRAYVIDPVAQPGGILPLKEWLHRISGEPYNVRVAICDTNAYSPSTSCSGAGTVHQGSFFSHQLSYLAPEWNRLVNSGFDPRKALGENPPWPN